MKTIMKEGPGTETFSRLQNILKYFPSLVIHHLAIVDTLIHRWFQVFPKIAIGDLSKQFHVLFSTFSLSLQILNNKKNYQI